LPTDATKDVQSTIQNTTKAAQDAATDATRNAQDTTKNATDAARNLQKSTTDAAQDATKRAQDAARDATNRAQDATRDATKRVQDATKDATDATRNLQRDATRDVRDATRAPSDDQQRDQRSDPSLRARGSLSAGATTEYRGADLGVWFDRSAVNGLVIADVAADAALGRFGFVAGDRIVSIGGQPIVTEADFIRLLLDANARDRIDVIVTRGGRQQTLYVEPAILRERITASASVDPLEQFGIILDDRYSDRLVVWRVVPRSPAFYAGIRASDVLLMFGGRRINNSRELVQLVEQTQPGNISLQVARNGRTRVIEADFPQLEISRSHTTFRQNLDADANIRSNVDAGTPAGANADAGIRAGANADVQVDAAPAYRNYTTDRNYYQPRRGLFRRGR
jgi:C-terminal processing protease CtpA/Prc